MVGDQVQLEYHVWTLTPPLASSAVLYEILPSPSPQVPIFEMATPSCVRAVKTRCRVWDLYTNVRPLCWLPFGRCRALCCWHNCPPQRLAIWTLLTNRGKVGTFASSFSFKIGLKGVSQNWLAEAAPGSNGPLIHTGPVPPAPSPTALTPPWTLSTPAFFQNKPTGKPAWFLFLIIQIQSQGDWHIWTKRPITKKKKKTYHSAASFSGIPLSSLVRGHCSAVIP